MIRPGIDLQFLAPSPTNNIVDFFVKRMSFISVAKRLPHTLFHFLSAPDNVLTSHNMSGRPLLARYEHFRKICSHTGARLPCFELCDRL